MILVAVILMDLLVGVELDIFVPSFPLLQNQFHLSPFLVEALLSINFVGYCVSLFLVGGLADRYGRKPIIILGLVIFIVGSILCLLNVFILLLIGRFFQGIGIAAPAILSFLIIADSYPLKKQQYLIAMLNGLMNISIAIAPVVGSYITLYFKWQGNFVALLALGIISLIVSVFFIPAYKLSAHKQTLSLQGYIPLLQSKPLMLLIVNIVFIFVPYWIFVGMSPLLYLEDLGVSLSQFGYYQGSFALVFALGSIIFGLIIHRIRFQQKQMLYLSMYIFIFSLLTIAVATFLDSHSPLLITLAFIPFIIGQVIPSTILYPLCLNFIPQAKAKISALLQGSRLMFTALFLELAGYYYEGSFQNIGIILTAFILLVVITLFLVIKNPALQ